MKNILFFLAIVLVVGSFFGYDEIKRYRKNIQIEDSPAYALGAVKAISPEDRFREGRPESYVVNYEFKVNGNFYNGETNSVDYPQAKSYKQRMVIKVAYLDNDPSINTPASYFRQGKTTPELKEGLVISALLGFAGAIPLFFFVGLVMWVIRKIRSQL